MFGLCLFCVYLFEFEIEIEILSLWLKFSRFNYKIMTGDVLKQVVWKREFLVCPFVYLY